MKTTRLLLFRKLTRLLLAVLSVVVVHTWQPKAAAEDCQTCGLPMPGSGDPPGLQGLKSQAAAKEAEMLGLLRDWQTYTAAATSARNNGLDDLAAQFDANAGALIPQMTTLAEAIQALWDAIDAWENSLMWCSCPPEEECPVCYLLVSLCICTPEETCSTCFQLVSACTCPPPEESCPNCYELVSACICQTCATCYNLIASCTCPPPETCATCSQLIASCTCPPPEQTCVNCNLVVSQCICGPLP